jgi:DNA-binding MarR family transcriptional regulator
VLTGLYDEELRPAGVPAPQFALLMLLVKRPEASQRQLAAWLAMEQSTLSRNLQAVARRGWVSSHTEAGSRVAQYRVTTAGRAVLRRARPGWQRAQTRVQRELGADWQALWPLLRKLSLLGTDARGSSFAARRSERRS